MIINVKAVKDPFDLFQEVFFSKLKESPMDLTFYVTMSSHRLTHLGSNKLRRKEVTPRRSPQHGLILSTRKRKSWCVSKLKVSTDLLMFTGKKTGKNMQESPVFSTNVGSR